MSRQFPVALEKEDGNAKRFRGFFHPIRRHCFVKFGCDEKHGHPTAPDLAPPGIDSQLSRKTDCRVANLRPPPLSE